MASKPKLLVTRRLPQAVTERLNAAYDAVTNADDHIMSPDEVIEKAQGKDALLVTPADEVNAAFASMAAGNGARRVVTFDDL